jgi:3-hydroxyacyl-CoA dehydrogenase/enoyl-CoA hydratase/3-hydroxybutyryl-CoA epimerase
MVEAGRLGKKNGKGFYKYAGKKRLDDPAVEEFIDVAHQTILDEEQMQKRMVYPMINEAARCLEEGIVERPRDVDIGMIFGTGFAPFKGGLLKYADSEGLKSVIEMLKKFETEYGERFKPAEALQKIATTNGTFY